MREWYSYRYGNLLWGCVMTQMKEKRLCGVFDGDVMTPIHDFRDGNGFVRRGGPMKESLHQRWVENELADLDIGAVEMGFGLAGRERVWRSRR